MLTLHIAAAGTWLGANVVQALAPGLAARQGVAAMAGWYRVTVGLSNRLYIPAGVLILLTGVVMVLLNDAYSFGSLFVTIGFAVLVVGALLGSFVFAPGAERAAQAIEAGDPAAIRATIARLTKFGVLDTVLVLFAMTVMVLRLT